MASISNDGCGRRLQFVNRDGNRIAIRLGKCSGKQADFLRHKIESLISASLRGTVPDDDTNRWLGALDDTLHDRIARAGLTEARTRSAATLGKFLAEYEASLNVKASTRTFYGHTIRNLKQHFGESRALRSIGPADAVQWRQAIAAELSPATVNRRGSAARSMFIVARRWKLIAENPFDGIKAGGQINRERQYFVTREMAGKLLESAPDCEWRLLVSLSRFGGLRIPSEMVLLRWADVDWEHGRLTVHSPKTERHLGGDSRVIPLFPEIRQPLLDCFERAEPGQEFVITKYRSPNCKLRTQLERIILRAGLTPWPKLLHNMRASRQTELAEQFPIQVVCAWIGNSVNMAKDHYLQVTDNHFAKAIMPCTNTVEATSPAPIERLPVAAIAGRGSTGEASKPYEARKSPSTASEQAAHNPAQYGAVRAGKPVWRTMRKPPFYLALLIIARLYISK